MDNRIDIFLTRIKSKHLKLIDILFLILSATLYLPRTNLSIDLLLNFPFDNIYNLNIIFATPFLQLNTNQN